MNPAEINSNITLSGLADLETILDTARQCVRRVRLAGENGDMGPDEASKILCDALDSIKGWSNKDAIALLRNSLPVEHEDAPPVPESLVNTTTRYFTDGTGIWKFAPGKSPQTRFLTDKAWDDSAFTSLSEFEKSPGDTWEIDEEDAEP